MKIGICLMMEDRIFFSVLFVCVVSIRYVKFMLCNNLLSIYIFVCIRRKFFFF